MVVTYAGHLQRFEAPNQVERFAVNQLKGKRASVTSLYPAHMDVPPRTVQQHWPEILQFKRGVETCVYQIGSCVERYQE